MSITVTKSARDRVQSIGDQFVERPKIATGAGDTSLTFKAAGQSGAHCRKITKIEEITGAVAVIAAGGRTAVLTLPESATIQISVSGRRSGRG